MWCSVARRDSVRPSTMLHCFVGQRCAIGNEEEEDCFRVDLSLYLFFLFFSFTLAQDLWCVVSVRGLSFERVSRSRHPPPFYPPPKWERGRCGSTRDVER